MSNRKKKKKKINILNDIEKKISLGIFLKTAPGMCDVMVTRLVQLAG